jgi:methionine S-methyltransferase
MRKLLLPEKDFLQQCRESSQNAYEAFKNLLLNLENSETRNATLQFLHNLLERLNKVETTDEMMKYYHFSLSEFKLKNLRLLLLRLPSTFAPEDWSYTFFEGLSRYKISEFEDRRVVELGCGIGWISLALAMQTRPKKIFGLDINPRAITCARINLFLNAYDKNGNSTWQSGGQNLDEVIEFQVSDLFDYCRQRNLSVDRVIGCIPQVLNPDPDFTTRMLKGDVSENASDEFLHSLSNYAPKQGQIEDQFGLGLIAKAVEDSVYVLKGTGKIILNLGGRPGKKVLQQLFLRRGFSVRQVWQTQVEQAKDTDIRGLVEIEKNSSHRFEFYIEQGGDTPIPAKTALAYAEAGGRISHGLMVYEAELRDPSHLPQIIKSLGKPGFEDARNAIDLSYTEEALVEEKASFLCALAAELEQTGFFPYQKTSGFEGFRKNLASFFKNYFHIYYNEENFVITPSRLVSCRNIMTLYKPKRVLIDSQLHSDYLIDCEELIEIPQGSDLLCELISKLRPEVVLYTMPGVEAHTSDALLRIIDVSSRAKTRVIIDISEFFELSSTPVLNGFFRYLENHELSSHVSLMCGLVKNKIYSDLQVCFVISENRDFLTQLTNAAELTYSRTPFLSQFYYNSILNDLLSFQIFEDTRSRQVFKRGLKDDCASGFIGLAKNTEDAFSNPAIVGERQSQASTNLIRLDYGENCLPAPPLIKQLLFEAFAHKTLVVEDCDPSTEIINLTALRWALAKTDNLTCICSGGVAPIFSEIASYCARSGEKMIFPCGAYGYFLASAAFHGAAVEKVATDAARGFKVNIAALTKVLAAAKGAWLVLSAPIVNPTGAIYSATEIKEIADVVANYGSVLVLDSIFSGLSFYSSGETNRCESNCSEVGRGVVGGGEASNGDFYASDSSLGEDIIENDVLGSCSWLILGGVSKEFAAGGLRIGYGISSDARVINAIKAADLTEPHKTLKFVLKKLYKLSWQKSKLTTDSIQSQRLILKARALQLSEMLKRVGWQVLEPRGGLFLIATPEKLLGKSYGGMKLEISNIAQVLRDQTGVLINSPEWIGIPNYFRFVLSVTDEQFTKALHSIESFSLKVDRS